MSPDRDDAPGGSSPTPHREAGADADPEGTRTLGQAGEPAGKGGGRDATGVPTQATQGTPATPPAPGTSPTPPTPPATGTGEAAIPPHGARVGHFRIERPIGSGGAGSVFVAEDLDIPGRRVALKLIRAGGLTPDLDGLRREASALAQLRHPHILVVHEIGASDWGPYLVTELMESGSLAARLRRGPLPERQALRLARGIASALAAAHARGHLHRDIKPANLLLGREEGAVKVADFGLVWLRAEPEEDEAAPPDASSSGSASGTGASRSAPTTGARRGPISGREMALNRGVVESAGTPPYIAPEVLEGHPPDAAADQFAFGVTLCELLTGKRPFEGKNWSTKVMSGAPEIPAGMSRDVEAIVRRAIARRQEDRFPAMSDIVAALDAMEARRDPRRRRLAWTIAASAALFAILVGGFWLLRFRQAAQARSLNEAGAEALKRGDHDGARRAFLEAHGADPSNRPACASLGQLAAEERNPTWAITILQECASTFPEAPDVHYNLGMALLLTGRAEAGERELRLAVTLAGNAPAPGESHSTHATVRRMALNNLAMALIDGGRASEAMALLEPEAPFRADQREDAILAKSLGLAYVGSGRFAEGATFLRQALAGPLPAAQRRAALVGLGRALEESRDAAGALEAYSQALLAAGDTGEPDDAVAAAARAGLARLQP